MSWFDQLSLWDDSLGEKKWRIRARERGEKYAVAVLWEYNGHRLRAEHGCINSEHTAADIAVRLNGMVGWFGIGLFRVQPGGDSLDNPCISIVWTNSKAVADEVVKMCGKENTEVVDLTEALVDAV